MTSDKEGANSTLDKELHDADVVISQPFWPAYMTAERIAKAPKLKLSSPRASAPTTSTLQAAIKHGITVAEVTYCNSISVAEHVVMMILASCAITSRPMIGCGRAAGTSPIASSAPTTSKACMSARLRRAASAPPCYAG